MNNEFNLNAPSHIFVGSAENLKKITLNILKKLFCSNLCNYCSNCIKIANNNHENILWLQPEKQYNLEQIDLVQQKISYLQQNDKFFVILQAADLLTTACSNRLLKSIEEPSFGYYFLFLTDRPNAILPTIYSRCVVVNYNSDIKETVYNHEIGKFFVNFNSDPTEFLKILDKTNINEIESMQLLDNLINYWSKNTKQYLVDDIKRKFESSENILNVLMQEFKNPIMPGSSKLFWRNLFLKLNL